MRKRAIGYWAATALVAFVLVAGGAAQLARMPQNVEGMVHLGYPAYLLGILGFWKVLGGLAILAPRLPRLKEWAYAGAFFDLSGAAASHFFAGDPAARVFFPALFALVAVASWALRPPARTMGALFPARAAA